MSFENKLKQSSVFKAVAAYAAVSFVLIQVASLVSDTFGLNQDFMQNMIWVFLVGFPFTSNFPRQYIRNRQWSKATSANGLYIDAKGKKEEIFTLIDR